MTERLLTFAHIERGDVMVAKDGSRWLVGRVERVVRTGTTRVRIVREDTTERPHEMEKSSVTPVVLDRPDEPKRSERGSATAAADSSEYSGAETDGQTSEPSLSEAVATVESELGGQVVASVTDAQQASLDSAVETGEVLKMPAFSTYSMLSARSHLFLLHNVIAEDVVTMKELSAMHDEVTKNPVNGPKVAAHVHES